jgi:hypothetical protein
VNYANTAMGTLVQLSEQIKFIPAERLFQNDNTLIVSPIIGTTRVDLPKRQYKKSFNNFENFYISHSPIKNSNLSYEEVRCAQNIAKLRGCPIGVRKPEEMHQVNAELINFYINSINYVNSCVATDIYLLNNYEILFKRQLIKEGVYERRGGKSYIKENRVEETVLQVILPRTGTPEEQKVRKSAFLKLLGINSDGQLEKPLLRYYI